MKMHTMPRMSRAARWLRGHWPDRNPLRRATDRAEAVVIGLLVLAFLALAPGAAALASRWAAPHTTAGQARYEVPAVLTSVGPDPITLRYSQWVSVPARARWSTPAGHVRTGDIPVTAGTRAGATIMIWITSAAAGPVGGRGRQAAAARRAGGGARHGAGGLGGVVGRPHADEPAPDGGLGCRLAGDRPALVRPPLSAYCCDRIASSSASGSRTTGPRVSTTARLITPGNVNGAS